MCRVGKVETSGVGIMANEQSRRGPTAKIGLSTPAGVGSFMGRESPRSEENKNPTRKTEL